MQEREARRDVVCGVLHFRSRNTRATIVARYGGI